MKTITELIAENNELKTELKTLQKKFKYLVIENAELDIDNNNLLHQLSSRKKSWFQRWLGI